MRTTSWRSFGMGARVHLNTDVLKPSLVFSKASNFVETFGELLMKLKPEALKSCSRGQNVLCRGPRSDLGRRTPLHQVRQQRLPGTVFLFWHLSKEFVERRQTTPGTRGMAERQSPRVAEIAWSRRNSGSRPVGQSQVEGDQESMYKVGSRWFEGKFRVCWKEGWRWFQGRV